MAEREKRQWRIWGKDPHGRDTPVTVGATDDEVTVQTPEGKHVHLPPDKAGKLRQRIADSIAHVLHGRRW